MTVNASDLWMPSPLPPQLEASGSDYKMARYANICQFRVFLWQEFITQHCPLLPDIQQEDPTCHGGFSQLPDRAWSSTIARPD